MVRCDRDRGLFRGWGGADMVLRAWGTVEGARRIGEGARGIWESDGME